MDKDVKDEIRHLLDSLIQDANENKIEGFYCTWIERDEKGEPHAYSAVVAPDDTDEQQRHNFLLTTHSMAVSFRNTYFPSLHRFIQPYKHRVH